MRTINVNKRTSRHIRNIETHQLINQKFLRPEKNIYSKLIFLNLTLYINFNSIEFQNPHFLNPVQKSVNICHCLIKRNCTYNVLSDYAFGEICIDIYIYNIYIYIFIYISKFVMKALFYTCFSESNAIFNIYNLFVELFDGRILFFKDHYLVTVAILQMWGCCLPLYWFELRTRSIKSMGEKASVR